MTFIQFITTFAYATMLATFVSAPLEDVRQITSIIQRKQSDRAVALKNHLSFGNIPIKISPLLSLPPEVMSSKMTVDDFERFPVLFNVTENFAAVEFDHLLNMTPYHRHLIVSPVVDASNDHDIVLLKSDLVPAAIHAAVYNTTIRPRTREQDGYALCPIHKVSFVQVLYRNLHFDRSFFISVLLLAFLGSLLEWDNNPPAHEEPKASGKAFFFLLVPPSCDHDEELILSQASFLSPPRTTTNVPRTRRTVSWNLDFKVREIPRLSQEEKMERKRHFFETVTWSTKNAVSNG
jgi:hypothetical protein